MKRLVLALVALALSCAVTRPAGVRDAAFHSPLQPLDQGVLSTIPTGKRDFRRDPPRVAEAAAERLPAEHVENVENVERVRLRVRFAESGLPRVLELQAEREPVALRDDGSGGDEVAGDGVFTGTAMLPDDFLAEREALARRLTLARQVTVFRGRQLVQIEPPKPQRLKGVPLLSPFDFPPPAPVEIDSGRSLFITDFSVLRDPVRTGGPCNPQGNAAGPWTFAYLMTEMANQEATGVKPSDFVKGWLTDFDFFFPVNGDTVPKNTAQGFLDQWPKVSGTNDLDLTKPPFRLVAIVNRLDLADNPGYAGKASAGELRFLFAFAGFDCAPSDLFNPVGQFNVIFEFGVPPLSCIQMRDYAKKWQALSAMTLGSPEYNAALQAITDPIVKRGAGGTKPNGSAINQVRSNRPLGGPWQLRESRITADMHQLRITTVKQTPRHALNGTKAVVDYVGENAAPIKNNTYVVPLDYPAAGIPFLGAHALAEAESFWQGSPPVADNEARHLFSLNTCNGCHGAETGTIFTHIDPELDVDKPATASGFMVGTIVHDPVDGTPREFNDLLRRKQRLAAVANTPCLARGLFQTTLKMVH